MSPRPFTIVIDDAVGSSAAAAIIASVSSLGKVSPGIRSSQHFIVIEREREAEAFLNLAEGWKAAGTVSVEAGIRP